MKLCTVLLATALGVAGCSQLPARSTTAKETLGPDAPSVEACTAACGNMAKRFGFTIVTTPADSEGRDCVAACRREEWRPALVSCLTQSDAETIHRCDGRGEDWVKTRAVGMDVRAEEAFDRLDGLYRRTSRDRAVRRRTGRHTGHTGHTGPRVVHFRVSLGPYTPRQ